VQNTDTLSGQIAEFLFGLKAGDAYALPECYTVPPGGWKWSRCCAFTRLDGIWGTESTKLMKYLNMHNCKKKKILENDNLCFCCGTTAFDRTNARMLNVESSELLPRSVNALT